MYAKIQPVSAGYPAKTADRLRVTNVQINRIGADGEANVCWQLYNDATGSVFESANKLEGLAYDAWGLDDAYLLTWLAEPSQLDLTIVEIVASDPAPPAPPVDVAAPTNPAPDAN